MEHDALKIFTLVTPSHEPLLSDWFLRTLPVDCQPVVQRFAAPPVEYAKGQWHRVVAQKFEILRRAFASEPEGSIFVMSDVDVRFYQPFSEDVRQRIEGRDVLFQNNRPGLAHAARHICTGFMVIRCCPRARAFFERAYAVLLAADHPRTGDQYACIHTLEEGATRIRYALLPDRYWTPVHRGAPWQPFDPLAPPADVILHHANKTIGVPNKIAQLRAGERLTGADQPAAPTATAS